jgi:hypothetical protein
MISVVDPRSRRLIVSAVLALLILVLIVAWLR